MWNNKTNNDHFNCISLYKNVIIFLLWYRVVKALTEEHFIM